MAFWKKSEDPWDQAPDLRRPPAPPREPEPRRQAGASEPDVPPMPCPFCGKGMARGYLYAVGGRDIWWLERKIGLKERLIGPDPNTSLLFSDEGVLYTYKTAWYCSACQRMVADTTGIRRPYGGRQQEEPHGQGPGPEQEAST